MQSSSTFIEISRSIPEVKAKSALINLRRFVQITFVPNTVGGSGIRHNPRKIGQSLPSFKLKQNRYINMDISFQKLGTFSPTNILCLKDSRHYNLTKYKVKGTSIIQFTYFLVNSEKFGNTTLAYIQKTQFPK